MKFSKKTVAVKKLRDGMVLAEPIYDIDGKTLFSEGLKLNAKRIERIMHLDMTAVMISEETSFTDSLINSGEREFTDEAPHKPVKDIINERSALRKEVLLNDTRKAASTVVEDVFNRVLDDGTIRTEKIRKIVERVIEVILYDDNLVLNLSNLSSVGDYLLSHSVNVCVLSLITGIHLGFSQPKLMKLGSGALIHDIGKMLVPQDILNKPDKLTDEEYEQIKQHAMYGHKILRDSMKYDDETSGIALSHHERIDGKGYPYGLNGHDIPIFAKIVSVVDVFDAMTTDKVYAPKVSYYKGVDYLLRHVNTQFDEDIVKKFITIIGYYPIGLPVKLSTGDLGQVMKKNKKKPVVKVLVDANGNKLKNYYEIDMYKNPSITIIDVDTLRKKPV